MRNRVLTQGSDASVDIGMDERGGRKRVGGHVWSPPAPMTYPPWPDESLLHSSTPSSCIFPKCSSLLRGIVPKPIRLLCVLKQTNKRQKPQQLCPASLSISSSLCLPHSQLPEGSLHLLFQLAHPSLHFLCPVARLWLHLTPEEGLSQISPGTSLILSPMLFTSQLSRSLCGRRHCPHTRDSLWVPVLT